MKNLSRPILLFTALILSLAACSKDSPSGPEKPAPVTLNTILVDSLATAETVALFKNLQALSQTGVMFGHQDDLAYGVGWWAEAGKSDIKLVCGDYPAVYGWDLGDIGKDANLDGVNFSQMQGWIKEAYSRGGVNVFSMHLDNPVSGGNSWDNSAAVAQILPGQAKHSSYLQTLDLIAAFFKDLKTDNGTYIPVVLRPYHEHNQTWSWWGKSACTADEYNALWIMTVQYFRDHHKLHHLLYAISPQDINTESAYFERYPGDDWVDILGLDYYQLWSKSSATTLGKGLQMMSAQAAARNKAAAITETGVENVPFTDWWTGYLLAALKYKQTKGIAWVLVWRNKSTDHFFGPYPGHKSEQDFITFYNDSLTLFENDLPDMYHE
ncbi:MAG TPA: glycosyl hydrolase [bacterium]|nr:glycosyl hydrolase [bacterium]HPN45045.1 glycosyl hydrolase [bacterium]